MPDLIMNVREDFGLGSFFWFFVFGGFLVGWERGNQISFPLCAIAAGTCTFVSGLHNYKVE